MDLTTEVLPTIAVTLGTAGLLSGGSRQLFGSPVVLSGKQYMLRVAIMFSVLLGTLFSFFGESSIFKVLLEQKYMILLSAAISISIDHFYGYTASEERVTSHQYTVPTEALNSVSDQQQCLHVHLNEPAKVKIIPSKGSSDNVNNVASSVLPHQDISQYAINGMGDGRIFIMPQIFTSWLQKNSHKAHVVYLSALGAIIGMIILAVCHKFHPLVVQERPVPIYQTSVGRFMIMGLIGSLAMSIMLAQLYLTEKERNIVTLSKSAHYPSWSSSHSLSHKGKIKMTKRSVFDDSQHRIQEYKYYLM